ncbi:dUTP diphosphatase [Mycoplasmopsis gallopavonis]|uniref:Uncharacterized protein conserved in bacteria n=1 Tax=Mycoplasmopsis gallopavonis TaxID=76629 RepID=A0A449B0I4_9BACT|nr:dUTP diphosphatase [Mycoplasmopsis gallopavonis]RIV17015.1 hypothetical protein D1113_00120 [Mycoplasmopsis gallopavonis]VEU73280.1 Uncharacterized protein conserved in bacteria [Mycoplasmopsis gallopavonis]
MNLKEIFEMQKSLDEKINEKRKKNNPNLSKKDVEIQKTLALIVEAGEFINEVQSFKYWKINKNIKRQAVMEEFADLLHFLVNFAYSYRIDPVIEPLILNQDINYQFQQLFISITDLMKNLNQETIQRAFEISLGAFVMLGFNYGDLFQAYFLKNQKNYQRLYSNY